MPLRHAARTVFRVAAITTAFVTGWIVYIVGMLTSTYDGCLSLLLQPIMAAVCSALFTLAATLAGLVLRMPAGRFWRTSQLWAGLVACCSLSGLALGRALGFTAIGYNPETASAVETLHPAAAVACYFLLLFSIGNWPFVGDTWPWRRLTPTGSAEASAT